MTDEEDVIVELNPDISEEDIDEYLQDNYINAIKYITEGELDAEDVGKLVSGYIYLYKFFYMPSAHFH